MRPINKAYRIIALILAFLVLVTSAGFSLDIHYCQDRVKTWSIFGSAKGCSGVERQAQLCDHKSSLADQKGSLSRKKCCENRHYIFQSHQEQRIPSSTLSVAAHPVKVIPVVAAPILPEEVSIDTRALASDRYKPPLIHRDIPVLSQAFLF